MKILIVCGGGYVYGLEKAVFGLAREMRRLGAEIRFATTTWRDGSFEEMLRAESFAFHPMPLGFISKSLRPANLKMTLDQALRLPRLWREFGRLRREFRPDAILHTNFHHLLVLGPALGRGEKHFLQIHSCYAAAWKYRLIFGALARRAEKFACVSGVAADHLRALGLPEDKIAVIPNGVSAEGAQPPERQAPRSPLALGMVGQVAPHKGLDVFVEALRLLRDRGVAFEARIFGRGEESYIARLKEKIAASGLEERVFWEGYVSDPAAIYSKIDLCVIPSEFPEPFGMVAIEAGLRGVPAIATRRGALPEIVLDGQTGFLAERGAADQIADAAHRLARDPELWRRMSLAAFERTARDFSIAASAQKMLALLGDGSGGGSS